MELPDEKEQLKKDLENLMKMVGVLRYLQRFPTNKISVKQTEEELGVDFESEIKPLLVSMGIFHHVLGDGTFEYKSDLTFNLIESYTKMIADKEARLKEMSLWNRYGVREIVIAVVSGIVLLIVGWYLGTTYGIGGS